MSPDKEARVLGKIIERIVKTMGYCEGQTFESFQGNDMLQEACVFNVLQIGELSHSELSEGFKKAHPEIEWREMHGLRNRIVHGYDGVNLIYVWETIIADFPKLLERLRAMMD